jgi:two-component system sensor histidine kinase KdpD
MDRPAGERKGELKVFLGYAPGVGKTYTMLDAAECRQAEGLRVLPIGFRYSGSADHVSLLHSRDGSPTDNSDVISDLDQVIQAHPDLVLLDDLTDQPAFSSRHQF